MRVLVNALSATNLSGRHVLLGHLSRLAVWTRGEHEYVVIHHDSNRDLCRDLGPNVSWVECPSYTAKWAGRAAWEMLELPRLAVKHKTDFMFSPSGTIVPAIDLPQVSFAQNPWPLVAGLGKSLKDEAKSRIQRKNYRAAVNNAAMMVYNSEYMRGIYRVNAGSNELASRVVYQAIDDETHSEAKAVKGTVVRKPLQVLSVSVWGAHKGLETVIEAMVIVRDKQGIPATLVIAGPWPDASYEKRIKELVDQLKLTDAVNFLGKVERSVLHQLYAESTVFCLMSHCESFGIPAVEAQIFGTPVVSSNCCAIPEVCGSGGLYPEAGDAEGTAKSLSKLLTDKSGWGSLSALAEENAGKYHWDSCSKGMLGIFDVF